MSDNDKWYHSGLVFWGSIAVIVFISYLPDIIHGPETACNSVQSGLESK